ncbi:MAG: amidohydrolase [Longimicrobiales bacterium]
MRSRLHLVGPAVFLVAGCATAQGQGPASTPPESGPPAQPAEAGPLFPDPFPSTYQPFPSRTTIIRNATVFTGTGERLDGGSILIRDGKIAEIGRSVSAPSDALVVDATGKFVTPGVIDPHSHLGVYASPGIPSLSDGNEATAPNTAEVWAEHSIWPQDPAFGLALAGGVTALHTLPGSANLIGGRSVTVKPVPSRTYQGMKFPGAPHGLKMACGENPKRVYAQRGPATRMANVAGWRTYFIQAQDYLKRWKTWREEGADPEKAPTRNLELESIAATLNGEIDAHWHCYRADEMVTAMDIANEFGFHIATFEHAVEGYKIRDYLRDYGACALMWADWWGFKLEAYDGIKENVALVHEAGACAVMHSDDAQIGQFLNLESAKALRAANEAGIPITKAEAVAWFTLNAARAIGIDDVTGSLEAGKNADVVIWSGDPFSIYTKTEKVFVDGALLYDRSAPDPHLYGDFMLGILPREVVR